MTAQRATIQALKAARGWVIAPTMTTMAHQVGQLAPLGIICWGLIKKFGPKLQGNKYFGFMHKAIEYIADIIKHGKS